MYKIVLFFALSVYCYTALAQSVDKDELQKQREQLRREIEETEKILKETRTTTKVNVGQLNVINKRIALQDNVIDNITGQLRFIEGDIVRSQKEVNKLNKVLDTLKQEYAKSMVYAYKTRNNYDFLSFIFSSSSFNDAIKRITYLKSYRNYREMQGDNIARTQTLIKERIGELSGSKQQKSIVLQEKGKEMSVLEKQQQEKQSIVSKLKGRQKELSIQLANKRKQDNKIKGMISAMIKREIALARKKAEADKKERDRLAAIAGKAKTTDTKSTESSTTKTTSRPVKAAPSVLVSSEADKALDASFERNRGALPWPVNGSVLIHYGNYTIPGTKISGDNPGVTIGTQVGTPVKSVFDGEVTLVSFVDDKQAVFIKHGKYFTVYSNLTSVSVQRGQTVKTSQVIGKAGSNDDGQGEVMLILMKENDNVNPELWLHK